LPAELISVTRADSAVIVRLNGSLGMQELAPLDAQLARIADERPQLVVVDLSAVEIIASCGMGSLIAFRREVSQSGGAVVLAAATPQVGESLRRAFLNKLFRICATVPEALANAGSRGSAAQGG
jgi:anti-anti-sigma factor